MSNRSFIARATALALGLVVLSSMSAAAQRAASVEFAAFGGGYFGSTIYQGPLPASPPGPVTSIGVNSSGLYGLRLGYNVQRQFGVEFSWSASDPSLTFGTGFNTGYHGDLSVNNFDIDAMFNFGQQKIWGYFALGLGWSTFSPTITDNLGAPVPVSSQSYFSGNTALGMKAFLNPHIALQFDARYRWSNTNHTTSAGVGCVYYCYSYASTWYGAGELSGGITYVAFK